MTPEQLFSELSQIRGTVKADPVTRHLYSTDASSYRVLPMGAAFPCDESDSVKIVRTVAKHGVSMVPRGGGTSLSGQTIGQGIIVDLSRHLNQILELNIEAGWVRVQAGMVLDSLNRALLPHGWMVGPDPASSMTATLGGMTGNNSTGSHSIVYGMMADHVKEVDVILADGSLVRFGPKSPEEIALLQTQDTLEGRLYREIPLLVEQVKDDILSRYPKTWRNVAGYNLNRILLQMQRGESLNLTPLIVGSEGTLGMMTAIKLGLVKRPLHAQLLVLQFDSLYEALALVPFLLEHRPSAVELIDQYFNHLTRQIPEYSRRLYFIEGDPRAVLVVEFAGNDAAELATKRAALADALQKQNFRGLMTHCTTPEDVANVWAVRKAGLGILQSKRGDSKPLAFVDDATVPVEHLADYALEFEKLCHDAGTEAAFYAHASAGCLHINPLINLKT
ncbi:MAG: FAD-binding oxidoreductase, partial [Anaerolineae bacterium]|nr:FAD-binding oxidoreductase [Anaerolineae bacterium]